MPQKIDLENLSKLLDTGAGFTCSYELLQGNFLEMKLNNEFKLNDLLPDHLQVRQYDGVMPTIKDYELRLDREKMRNPYYRAIVAHEFGHGMDEEQDSMWRQAFRMELNMEYSLGVFEKEFPELSDTEKIKWIMEIYRIRMQREINAWDHGRIVANLLDVKKEVYEGAMETGIQTHYSSELTRAIENLSRRCPDIRDNQIIELFNPFTSKVSTVSYGELQDMIPQLAILSGQSLDTAYSQAEVKRK